MNYLQPIANFMELSSLLIIWSKFERGPKNKFMRNLILVIASVFISQYTSNFKPIAALVVNYGFLIICLIFMYRVHFLDLLLKLIISYAIVLFMEFVIFLFITIICSNDVDVRDPYLMVSGSVALILSIMLIYFVPITNGFFSTINNYLGEINFQFKNLWVVNTLVYSVVIKIIWDMAPSFIINYRFFILVLFVLIYILNIYIYKNDVLSYEKEKMEQYHNKYAPVMTNIVEDVRSKQHEFKNHINAIYGIIQVANEREIRPQLEQYLKSLNKNLEKVDYVRISNNIINAIVYSKILEAKKEAINFQYNIENIKRIPIEDYELSEILSNLLNNAFEAILEDDTNERRVEFNIHTEKSYMIISVKNSGDTLKEKDVDKLFKKGFSTKNRGSGYGLYNVQQIVSETGGKIEVTSDNGYTTFKIILPLIKGMDSLLN